MAGGKSFDVTAAAQKASLGAGNAGEAAFTVTNRSQAPVKGRLGVEAQAPAQAAWFTVDGKSTRDFAPGAAEQVVVRIAVPAGTAGGSHAFQLNAWNEALPDEDFTEGQSVTFEVKAAERKRGFPWWIVAVVAVVLIGLGITAALFLGGDDPPDAPELLEPQDGLLFNPGQEVLFQWKAAEGADSYRLEVDTCTGGPCTGENAQSFARRDTPGDVTSASVQMGGVSGQWRVVARNGDAESFSQERRLQRRFRFILPPNFSP